MKAILLIDMPKDCMYCPVAHYNKLDEFTGCDIVSGKKYAMATDEDYKESIRASWCPLKPIPQKKDIHETIPASIFINGEQVDAYSIGWNDCIDKLLGEDK